MVVNDIASTTLSGSKKNSTKGALQIRGGWKLLKNPSRANDGDDLFYLFNVFDEPEEETDLSLEFPDVFAEMKSLFEELILEMVPEDKPRIDANIDITDGQGNLAFGWCS